MRGNQRRVKNDKLEALNPRFQSCENLPPKKKMRLGIILQSNKPEHAWNTFRLGITALKANHQVEIFLMSEGSELDTIPDSKDFDVSVKVAGFKELKGEIYACGSCLKVRGKEESKICPVSTMSDLLKMVERSDKVLVFG